MSGSPRQAPPPHRDMILEVAGLTMRFGGLTAVDEVSFDARRGEINRSCTVIGKVGARVGAIRSRNGDDAR